MAQSMNPIRNSEHGNEDTVSGTTGGPRPISNGVKIYSWNVLFRNSELDRAFDFVSKSDFDIFCLQEVPEEFLKRLQALPCHIAYRSERELLFRKGPLHNYIVILSKHPIEKEGEISFPDYWSLLPLRTKLFVYLMRPLHWSKIRNRNTLYVDIVAPEGPLRVFNLHTTLTRPDLRLREFEQAMTERDPSRPTIVCGDFNTIESLRMSVLNWFLGGRISDVLLYRRERTHIEKRFAEHELINPLYGGITHPFSQSQLDHILVSHSFSIQKAEILPDRIGSDHHPIRVEII
ncbi:MAG: endonuclease/exonuclease/phosphatase family protein [Minisyncoccia bacterium]